MTILPLRPDRRRHGTGLALLVAAASVAVSAASSAAAPAAEVCRDAPRAPFVDVGDAGTHTPAVDCLREAGIVAGTRVDVFDPDQPIRRDQMASLVARALEHAGVELTADTGAPFDDIDAASPHAEAVAQLADAGVVRGVGDDRFDPHAHVPRGQMTAFLVRAYEVVHGRDVDDAGHAFDDVDGHAHETTIAQAADLDLARGVSAERFVPDRTTSREENATFLHRLLGSATAEDVIGPVEPSREVVGRSLPQATRQAMTGTSWRTGCPVGLDDLRLFETTHTDFEGRDRVGLLVVHRDAAAAVRPVLETIRDERIPIASMVLIEHFGGDDGRSMAANNTHGFNCRTIAGTSRWSQHAYGRAVDLNPVQNPYVRDGDVQPDAGRAYLDRDDIRPGMFVEGHPVVEAFDAAGWTWGGRWQSLQDYHHFEAG